MQRFIILMYHGISTPKTTAETRYVCPLQQFEKHLQLLIKTGHTLVGIEAVERYYTEHQPLPDKAVLITLDDGFADNYLNAWPLLQRYQVPAIIYLVTGAIGKTNQWMGSKSSERNMLSWPQIKEMSNHGIQFGSHTVSHPKLNQLDDDRAFQELIQSKQNIEDSLGKACTHFAYPYGLFNGNTPNLVRQAGFTTACSTQSGFNNSQRDPLLLHRIEVYGNDPAWKLKQKLDFGINNAGCLPLLQYYAKRLWAKRG